MSMGLARWLAKKICVRNDLPEIFGDVEILVDKDVNAFYDVWYAIGWGFVALWLFGELSSYISTHLYGNDWWRVVILLAIYIPCLFVIVKLARFVRNRIIDYVLSEAIKNANELTPVSKRMTSDFLTVGVVDKMVEDV